MKPASLAFASRALIALALAVAFVLGAPNAHGQNVIRHDPLDPREVAGPFTVLDVAVTPQQFAAEYDVYLDGYLKLVTELDSDRTRYRTRNELKPGALLSVKHTAALHELNMRTLDAHAKLLADLCGRLKAQVPAEQAATVDSIREILALRVLTQYGQFVRSPRDIGERLTVLTPEIRRQMDIVRATHTANLAERIRAYRAFVNHCQELEIKQAEFREAAGVTGLTPQEAQSELNALRARAVELGKDAEANKAELEALKPRLQAAANWGLYRARITPEWIAVSREQMAALKEVEGKGPLKGLVANMLYEHWMPELMTEFGNQLPVTDERRNGGREAPEIIRDVLRLQGLTKEQQEIVRTMGRALVNAYRARVRKVIDDAIAANSYKEEHDSHGTWFLEELNKIGKAIGHPEIGVRQEGGFAVVPTVGLEPTISAADAEEFGEVHSMENAPRSSVRWYARSSLNPAPYPDDFAKQMQELLKIPPELMAVAETVAADAEARWNERVKPMLPDLNPRPDVRAGDNDEWRQECVRIQAVRAKAFAEAAASDNAMLDALAAGLGANVDSNALATLRAAMRTAECVSGRGFSQAALLDVPRAVLEAPVSDATRRIMMEEFASLAPQWIERANALLRVQIGVRELQMFSSGWAAAAEQLAPPTVAWAAGETETIERIAAKLSPAEADAWRAWTRVHQWPGFYLGVDGARTIAKRAIGESPDAAAVLAQLEPILSKASGEIQRTGDGAVEVLLRAGPRIRYLSSQQRPDSDETRVATERVAPFISVNWARAEMANQLVLYALPAEAARRCSITPIFALRKDLAP